MSEGYSNRFDQQVCPVTGDSSDNVGTPGTSTLNIPHACPIMDQPSTTAPTPDDSLLHQGTPDTGGSTSSSSLQ